MRVFAIYNPLARTRRACAWLKYEPGSDSYSIEVSEAAEPAELPLQLALLVEDGLHSMGDRQSRAWIASRVPPEDRDNIEDVLDACQSHDYYLPKLLASTAGRSTLDDFLLVEVPAEGYQTYNLNRVLESPVDLGTQLSRARRSAGLTQSQLAEQVGIQQAMISRIERGKGNPTLETLELLAKGCGRTLKISLE